MYSQSTGRTFFTLNEFKDVPREEVTINLNKEAVEKMEQMANASEIMDKNKLYELAVLYFLHSASHNDYLRIDFSLSELFPRE